MKNASIAVIGVILIALGTARMAQAFPTTFFGQDQGNGEFLRLSPSERINANAAQADFLSLLIDPKTESFESFTFFDLAPLSLTFGTAAPLGTLTTPPSAFGFVSEDTTDTGAFLGRYPTFGTKYWDVTSDPVSPPDAFSIAFAHPQAAFGFFATDVGDEDPTNADFDLILERSIGSPLPVNIDHFTGFGASGSVLFFGIIDPNDPFTKVTFRNASSIDGFGVDDLTIASQVVPEPNTLFLLSSGLTLGGLLTWRKKRSRQ